ncbi:hypothetical protein JKP88DRAFT_265326 [Tribonema minus]|uniref:Protein kinase domain-containing protein n=1 Tax=Tribonema minus TaxID=303371 RepID=A0A835YLB9_9STRA|nr:hypothetical protein JKP88DRAFT_265326 [Tribonema minus]
MLFPRRSKPDIYEACSAQKWDVVTSQVNASNVNNRDAIHGGTVLHWVAKEGNAGVMEHLFACGADLRAADSKHGASALHWAAASGHVLACRRLLARGIDVDVTDRSGKTVLHGAAGNGKTAAAKDLSRQYHYAHRTETTLSVAHVISGKTALHWAAGNGKTAVAKELVTWGAALNVVDNAGGLPLHAACFRGHADTAAVLVALGATLHACKLSSAQAVTTPSPRCQHYPEALAPAHGSLLITACFCVARRQGSLTGVRDGEGHLPGQNMHPDTPEASAAASCTLRVHGADSARSGTYDHSAHAVAKQCCNPHPRCVGPAQQHSYSRAARRQQRRASRTIPVRSWLIHDAAIFARARVPLLQATRAAIARVIASAPPSSAVSIAQQPAGGGAGGARALQAARATSARLLAMAGEARKGGDDVTAQVFQLSELAEACGQWSRARMLGEGGFGAVYSGTLPARGGGGGQGGGADVAVKRLDEGGMQGREQFAREVEILSTCRHKNVVPLLGVCVEPPCLVYRLMAENSLRSQLRAGGSGSSGGGSSGGGSALPWRSRVRIAADAARGLEYLHAEAPGKPPVAHRDVKPENILLDRDGSACLSDFGISRVGRAGSGRPCGGQALEGDFHYMCPVLRGGGGGGTLADDFLSDVYGLGVSTPKYDNTSDVYGLGVVVCELLTEQAVHSPARAPPGIVDLIRECCADVQRLRREVDARAGWSKGAAKAIARLARACTAGAPLDRPPPARIAAALDEASHILKFMSSPLSFCHWTDWPAPARTAAALDKASATLQDCQLFFLPMLCNAVKYFEDAQALSALPLESYSPGASAATVKAHRRGGLLLASNPRLLCLCCREDPSGGNGGAPGVAILDLWQQGRTVFFPTSTKPLAAAISPFRGETYVCVQTGTALQVNAATAAISALKEVHSLPRQCVIAELALDDAALRDGGALLPRVYSLPRQCVIAELALDDAALRDGGALLRWRWLGPGVLVLIAEQGVYYWPALAKGAAAAAAPQRGFSRTTEVRPSAAAVTSRSHRLSHGSPLLPLLLQSLGLARVAGYDCSADGKWAVLSALHADGSGAVALDVRCFPARATFAMPALGAALLVMPGSSPPVNLLALVVQNEMGQPELRGEPKRCSNVNFSCSNFKYGASQSRQHQSVTPRVQLHMRSSSDSDNFKNGASQSRQQQSIMRILGSRRLYRRHGHDRRHAQLAAKWKHCSSTRCPPAALAHWPRNPHVLCVVARDGVLRLFDVHTCARLHCCRVASGPVLEAEVDAEQ